MLLLLVCPARCWMYSRILIVKNQPTIPIINTWWEEEGRWVAGLLRLHWEVFCLSKNKKSKKKCISSANRIFTYKFISKKQQGRNPPLSAWVTMLLIQPLQTVHDLKNYLRKLISATPESWPFLCKKIPVSRYGKQISVCFLYSRNNFITHSSFQLFEAELHEQAPA